MGNLLNEVLSSHAGLFVLLILAGVIISILTIRMKLKTRVILLVVFIGIYYYIQAYHPEYLYEITRHLNKISNWLF